MALTKKKLLFCEEYVKDYNGTQAAIRAGYKESNAASQASRMLKDSEILEQIRKSQKKLIKESCLTEEKIINKLEIVLDRCMSAVPVMEWDYEEHAYVPTGEYQFDSKGTLKAIELLGKHLGMFDNKNNKSPDASDNSKEFTALIKSINNQAVEVWKNEDKT